MTVHYPRITHSDVRMFIDKVVRVRADEASVTKFIKDLEVDESGHPNTVLSDVVRRLDAACGELKNSDLEVIEAQHCASVFEAIEREFDDEALGDVEFWNYLSIRYFWRFVSRRQESAWLRAQGEATKLEADEADRAKLERYLLGKDHYQIPLRMYLRAQSVREEDSFELTDVEGGSTDFWRSQVLGVRTAMYPAVARTVARLQSERNLNIEGQRPAGRRVNRLRANIDFVLHHDADADQVIRNLWVVTDDDLQRAEEKKRAKATKKAASKKPGSKKSGSSSRKRAAARPADVGDEPAKA